MDPTLKRCELCERVLPGRMIGSITIGKDYHKEQVCPVCTLDIHCAISNIPEGTPAHENPEANKLYNEAIEHLRQTGQLLPGEKTIPVEG